MDLKKLALSLGLKEDAKEAEIFAALGLALSEGVAAKKSLAEMIGKHNESLSAHGLKIGDDGKVVKLDAPPPTEGEKALKSQVLSLQAEAAKRQIADAKMLAKRFVDTGKVPPAALASLEKLFTVSEKTIALALSDKGDVQTVEFEGLKAFKEVLDSLPGWGRGLQQTPDAKKEAEALSAKAREVARRVGGVKEDDKGKK